MWGGEGWIVSQGKVWRWLEVVAEVLAEGCLAARVFSGWVYRLRRKGVRWDQWIGWGWDTQAFKAAVRSWEYCWVNGKPLKSFKQWRAVIRFLKRSPGLLCETLFKSAYHDRKLKKINYTSSLQNFLNFQNSEEAYNFFVRNDKSNVTFGRSYFFPGLFRDKAEKVYFQQYFSPCQTFEFWNQIKAWTKTLFNF